MTPRVSRKRLQKATAATLLLLPCHSLCALGVVPFTVPESGCTDDVIASVFHAHQTGRTCAFQWTLWNSQPQLLFPACRVCSPSGLYMTLSLATTLPPVSVCALSCTSLATYGPTPFLRHTHHLPVHSFPFSESSQFWASFSGPSLSLAHHLSPITYSTLCLSVSSLLFQNRARHYRAHPDEPWCTVKRWRQFRASFVPE